MDIHKAGAVILDGAGNFLVTRSTGKDIFIAPGGKLEAGETALEALARELMEEVQIKMNTDAVEHLGTFQAAAAGQADKTIEMSVWLVNDYTGQLTPSSEVAEIKWINSNTRGIQLGSIFEHEIIPLLKARHLID